MTTTTMVPAINIQGLKRTFGAGSSRVTAVAEVDITVQKGEVVALLGPNGAGKTTTLDMLLGLSDPTSGTVEVLGQSPRQAVQSGDLAAVLQTGGLLADITVWETVEVLASFHRVSHRVPEVMGADASAGRTIIFATHYLEEAEKFAPRTIVMNRGQVPHGWQQQRAGSRRPSPSSREP